MRARAVALVFFAALARLCLWSGVAVLVFAAGGCLVVIANKAREAIW